VRGSGDFFRVLIVVMAGSGGTNFLNYQVNCKKTVRGIAPPPHLFSF